MTDLVQSLHKIHWPGVATLDRESHGRLATIDRVRLLKFMTGFGLGGTEQHLVNLFHGLDHSRFAFELACMKRSGHFLREFEERHIPIGEYPVKNLYGLGTIKQRLRFAHSLTAGKIAIVHSYNFYANVFAVPAARFARTPVVLASIRDIGAYLTPRQQSVQRHVCRLADGVLVNAEAVRRWLVNDGYDDSKISVIHNGLDLKRFESRPAGPSLRRELGLTDGAPLVALLARIDPVKRVEDFLEAAALVAARFEGTRFIVVGDEIATGGTGQNDGQYGQQMESLANRLGLSRRVIFTGVRFDVPRVLADVAVSVLPSTSEGLSNTILESMAAGIPVVATAVGGTPELVDDGVTGFLVAPRNPAALAQAIGHLLEHPEQAKRMGCAGRDKVVRMFSLDKMINAQERLYEQLIDGKQRNATMPTRSHLEFGRPSVELDTVEDLEGFAKLREEWTQLLSSSRANCIFLTWEWLFTWWKHFANGRTLSIMTVRSGGQLVGLTPTSQRPPSSSHLWTLRPLEFLGVGSVGSDYLDIIVRPGYEDVVTRALAARLGTRSVAISLAQLRDDGAAARDLARELAIRGWRVARAVTDVCPFVDLRGHTWTTYLESVGPALRYNLRRRLRNLEKLGEVRFEAAENVAQCLEGFDRLVALHNQRWTERGGSQAFHEPALISFHKDFIRLALDRGWLRLLTLSIDGTPVSLLYCLRYEASFLGYQSGFDLSYRKHSVGLVSVGLAIRTAIEEGATEYDFLHGSEEYKGHWSSQQRTLARLELYPGHFRGLVGHRSFGLHRTARRIAKRAIQGAVVFDVLGDLFQ
jgi:L-malate glycosyltransferase